VLAASPAIPKEHLTLSIALPAETTISPDIAEGSAPFRKPALKSIMRYLQEQGK
jgi:hypothetical protein